MRVLYAENLNGDALYFFVAWSGANVHDGVDKYDDESARTTGSVFEIEIRAPLAELQLAYIFDDGHGADNLSNRFQTTHVGSVSSDGIGWKDVVCRRRGRENFASLG